MELNICIEEAGWASVSFSNGNEKVNMYVSYLNDNIGDLLKAINQLIHKSNYQKCNFQDEPGEFRLVLQKDKAGKISITIIEFEESSSELSDKEGRVIFNTSTSLKKFTAQLYMTITDNIQRIGIDGYQKRWNYGFPENEYKNIERYLRRVYGSSFEDTFQTQV